MNSKKSKKNYAKAAIEINHLRQSSKQFFKEYTTKKYHLSEELERKRKIASEKAWTSTAKICSLEIELCKAKEKINQ